jgi:multisubunit Na+/H+ antiporter MnhC subunit
VRAISDAASKVSRDELWRKPPNKDKETKAADPIAKPFPIAAVVLPAASRASVLSLTYSPISAISEIPPALSLIGP